MSQKVLRRCDLCGKFHAAYSVDDEQLGHMNLCYTCWHAKYAPDRNPATPAQQVAADAETNPLRRKLKKEEVKPA